MHGGTWNSLTLACALDCRNPIELNTTEIFHKSSPRTSQVIQWIPKGELNLGEVKEELLPIQQWELLTILPLRCSFRQAMIRAVTGGPWELSCLRCSSVILLSAQKLHRKLTTKSWSGGIPLSSLLKYQSQRMPKEQSEGRIKEKYSGLIARYIVCCQIMRWGREAYPKLEWYRQDGVLPVCRLGPYQRETRCYSRDCQVNRWHG